MQLVHDDASRRLLRYLRQKYAELVMHDAMLTAPDKYYAFLTGWEKRLRRYVQRAAKHVSSVNRFNPFFAMWPNDERSPTLTEWEQCERRRHLDIDHALCSLDGHAERRRRMAQLIRSVACRGLPALDEPLGSCSAGRFMGRPHAWTADEYFWTKTEFSRAVSEVASQQGCEVIEPDTGLVSSDEVSPTESFLRDTDGCFSRAALHRVSLHSLRLSDHFDIEAQPPKPFSTWLDYDCWSLKRSMMARDDDIRASMLLAPQPHMERSSLRNRICDAMLWNRSLLQFPDVPQELARRLSAETKYIDKISWRSFEELVAVLLVRMGYNVDLMPGRKDRGKDLVAVLCTDPSPTTIVVQCKHWPSRRVSVEPVQAFDAVVARHTEPAVGIMITSGWFTAGSRQWVSDIRSKLLLADFDDVQRWLHKNGWSDSEAISCGVTAKKTSDRTGVQGSAPPSTSGDSHRAARLRHAGPGRTV